MEAVGLYNFQADEKDELSFKKGDVLKVCLLLYGKGSRNPSLRHRAQLA